MRRASHHVFFAALLTLIGCGAEASDPIGTGGNTDSGTEGGSAGSGVGGSAGFGGAPGAGGGGVYDPSGTAKTAGGDGTQATPDVSQAGVDLADLKACGQTSPSVPFFFSADDSNSMASPVLARERLSAKQAPEPGQIRTYEFLNYYNALYDPPAPVADAADGMLAVHAELLPLVTSPTDPIEKLRLQVGVQAFQVTTRPALVLTFVIDTSGSLIGTGIARARDAVVAASKALVPGDIVNIVTWASTENVLLESYVAKGDASDDDMLAKAVQNLVPGGGSDLHAGLTKGYQIAEAHFDASKLNRLVLISDGGANLGVLDRDRIAAEAKIANDEGIYLMGIGVGPAEGYTDQLMNLVTDAGRGAYVYLDDHVYESGMTEAQSLFEVRFDEIMGVAARNVKVEIDLPDYLEIDQFYGEAYSTDVKQIDPQNLAPGDSMIFNERLYVTDSTKLCGNDTVVVKLSWETPITHQTRVLKTDPMPLSELLTGKPSPQFVKANAVISYAEALKTGTSADVNAALSEVESAEAASGDADLAEIAGLLKMHPARTQ